jgi:steroid Delta-isomerase
MSVTIGATPPPVITEYFATINADDFDATAALFADGATLIAPGTEPITGRAGIRSYYVTALRLYPEHRDEPTRVITAGSTVTVEVHFTGRVEAGGRLDFDAVDVFDLDDAGAIVRLSSWYDSHAVRRDVRALLG